MSRLFWNRARDWLKQTTLVVAALLALALTAAGVGSADPINANTTSFTATCTGLGEVTAVAIFFASGNPNAGGATSAFHVVGSNTVLIAFTPGTDRQAEQDGTTCTVTAINGEPIEPVNVLVKIVPSPPFVWDPVRDWLSFPDQLNPSPDTYGNPAVWSYLNSSGFEHDPGTYALLPHYSVVDGNREQWDDPDFVNLLVGRVNVPRAILMHSYGGRVAGSGRNAILAWTSPVNGPITIRGEVRLPDLAVCGVGSGIIWSIDQGATSLQTSVLPAGGSTTFDLSAMVQKGNTIYFVHDAGFDSNCDSAFLNLVISKP